MNNNKPITHLPCLTCSSSDAMTYYPSDGHSFCFSCGSYFGPETQQEAAKLAPNRGRLPKLTNHVFDYNDIHLVFPYRGLTKAVFDKYGVRPAKVNGNLCLVFPTSDGASKVRRLDEKTFFTVGPYSDSKLFGMERFERSSAKAITITEGEVDALSVYVMLGDYPCVSVKNGAQGAARDCAQHRDYINSFEKIYVCFDNDEPGRKASAEVARLFDSNKVYVVELAKYKDANEYLQAGAIKDFSKAWWGAQRFRPKGIISSFDEIDKVLDTEDADAVTTYPFATLENMTLGIRLNEVNLITAETGVGKTEVIRAIEYHILKNTDYNIGVIHLEEREKRAILGLATYELSRPAHRSDSGVSRDDAKEAFRRVVQRDDRAYFYQHFGSEDPDVILDTIRYLATACNCKFIFLDHITMLVTGYEGDDERKRLDYLSTRLAILTRELEFTLFLVSHVNDDGRTRGSRNIEKIADLWLHVNRDKENADPEVRNTMQVMVKKNRFAGETGPAGSLKFDVATYKLSEKVIPHGDDASVQSAIAENQMQFVEELTVLGQQPLPTNLEVPTVLGEQASEHLPGDTPVVQTLGDGPPGEGAVALDRGVPVP